MSYRVTPAIRMSRNSLQNEPDCYTYILQSFWPERWEGLIDGKFCRRNKKLRIDEPEHTQILLWLDRWRLTELILMVGMKATRNGFVITDRQYTIESEK